MTPTAFDLEIDWDGPYSVGKVIRRMDDEGEPPDYDGEDYGLYQIYGTHILGGPDTLLYVGKAVRQTFSARFRQHRPWLDEEDPLRVYLGRTYMPARHDDPTGWLAWEADLALAECILIYKYSPNYNSVSIADPPGLLRGRTVRLIHRGARHRLHPIDRAPDDWL